MDESGQEPCLCCGVTGKQGISIAGRFLCQDCERRLAAARPDSEDYGRLIERCKGIWAGYFKC